VTAVALLAAAVSSRDERGWATPSS
jgi:hypothetical protein